MAIIFRNLQGNPHTPINTETGEVLVREGSKVKKTPEQEHFSQTTRTVENYEKNHGTLWDRSVKSDTKEPIPISRDDYLAQFGLEYAGGDYNIDKTRIPHGETYRQRAKRLNDEEAYMSDYAAKRNEKINEYNEKVASGEFRQPTTIETALQRAKEHPDNASTQAARRLLEKKGIDWKTGKSISEKSSTSQSTLKAFISSGRQLSEAMQYAKKNGYGVVEFKTLTGATVKKYWDGGSWGDRPSSMAARFGTNYDKVYKAEYKPYEQ